MSPFVEKLFAELYKGLDEGLIYNNVDRVERFPMWKYTGWMERQWE
jgi:hypothetical protein